MLPDCDKHMYGIFAVSIELNDAHTVVNSSNLFICSNWFILFGLSAENGEKDYTLYKLIIDIDKA